MIYSFKELVVWRKAVELTKKIYQITACLPPEEKYNLIPQLKRAAISVPSNIAEGRQRKTRKDFVQFLHIAGGSLAEIETQLLTLRELYSHIDTGSADLLVEEVRRMPAVMIRRLEA